MDEQLLGHVLEIKASQAATLERVTHIEEHLAMLNGRVGKVESAQSATAIAKARADGVRDGRGQAALTKRQASVGSAVVVGVAAAVGGLATTVEKLAGWLR
jgi:hypothetical protein